MPLACPCGLPDPSALIERTERNLARLLRVVDAATSALVAYGGSNAQVGGDYLYRRCFGPTPHPTAVLRQILIPGSRHHTPKKLCQHCKIATLSA